MPLILPDRLPAIEFLREENIFVLGSQRADTQDIRPLRIAILNLMPLKITTETDLVRLLSNSPLQLEIHLMKVKAHTSKNTPIEHMRAFYRDFEEMRPEKFDGMIITGAPVEHLDFEAVNYWDEMTEIFAWARTHVTSTMYICWAAQAGLYYHYGIPKYPLPEKMFGIFPQVPLLPRLPIFRGFDDIFYMPHSRHTEIRREDILAAPELTLIAESEVSGDIHHGPLGILSPDARHGVQARPRQGPAHTQALQLLSRRRPGEGTARHLARTRKPALPELAQLLRLSRNALRHQ